MLSSIDTYQNNLFADQYHATISRAQVYSSSRSRDQVLVFDWIAGSCQVDLLKTEPGGKPNYNCFSLQMFLSLQLLLCVSIL